MPTRADRPAPRLVLLRMNWITGDSRIQKLALDMAERGWDVVVLGRSRTAAREVTTLGDPERGAAAVVRVPVPAVVAPYRKARRLRGLLGRIGFASRDDEVADRAAVNFLRRDLAADPGGMLRYGVRSAGVTAARARHMLRREATRRHAARLARVDRPGAAARAVAYRWLAPGAGWRATQPQLADFEAAFGPEIDALEPAIVHAQDITALAVGVRAVERARRAGRDAVMIYDAQEFVAGAGYPDPVQKAGYVGLERELVARTDGVVTVSDTLADLLQERYALPVRPTVAANAPRLARPTGHGGRGVRGAAGLPDDVPVLVYSGWLAPERGVDTLAEALVYLPDAHAVVVAGDRRPYFAELEARVADLGVADRFHFVPYVEPDEVVDHLATATVGVIPLRHLPNHEISLITKYYEYMHAGLPIVVSDVRTMAAFTRDLGCGEVFPAGDARRLAEAVQRVLADRSRYVKPYAADGFLDEHAWERQADNVAALYERLTGLAPTARDGRTLAREIRSGAAGFASGGGTAEPAPAADAAAAGREPRSLDDAAGLAEAGPRAVVLVGNPAGADRAEVRELARQVGASGFDTVLLAPDPGGLGASAWADGAQVLAVPAARTVAAGRDRRRGTDPVQARAARTYAAFLAADPGGVAAQVPGAATALRKAVAGRPGKRLHMLAPALGRRAALPEAFDAEAALRPVLDELRPQVIHACDAVALLTASHVAARGGVRIEYHRPASDDDGFGTDRDVRRALRVLERAVSGRADVVHGGAAGGVLAAAELSVVAPRPQVSRAGGDPYLVVGPANMAGQGWAWAQAVERYVAGARTEVVALHREGPLRFPADRYLSAAGWESAGVHLALRRHVAAQATHVLLESGLPLTGRAARSGHASGDTRALREAGVAVGLVFHGSDVRDPRRHRELYPESPFTDPNGALARELQPRYDARMADLADWDGPVFVSTPDLLDFVLDRWPHAVWLPVAVDTGIWRPGPEPLTRDRPVVLHAPSRGTLKSSALIDAVVGDFAARGLVEYRRAADVRPSDMPALVADADVVIDQLAIGNVGVLAAQAMAAGRLVVGHAAPRVRERYDGALPQLDATPSTLRGVLESVLDDRDHARELAAQGPGFASSYHDGRRSAAALAPFLARHHRTTQGEF